MWPTAVLSSREGCRVLFGGQLVLAVLGLVWIAVLTPALLRARAAHRHQPDFNAFYSSLSQLGNPSSSFRAHSTDPVDRRRMQLARRRTAERRRRVFNTLGGAALFSFAAAVLGNSATLWGVFGFAALLLGAYIGLLVMIARSVRPRTAQIAYLTAPITPQFVAQRAVNS